MPRDLILSKAFISLTGKAPQVLCIFYTKRKRYKVKGTYRRYEDVDDGRLKFTYIEAKDSLGISNYQFKTAIDQVVERGFIDIVEYGGGLHKSATIYHLSDRWKKYGQEGFQKKNRKKDSRMRHSGFQVI